VTAIAANERSPAETAENTAVRSAQVVRPYEAFSTLQPWNTLPLLLSNAAPTANRE